MKQAKQPRRTESCRVQIGHHGDKRSEMYRIRINNTSKWPYFSTLRDERRKPPIRSGTPLSKKAKEELVEWEPVDERIMHARFKSKIENTSHPVLCPNKRSITRSTGGLLHLDARNPKQGTQPRHYSIDG